ncbi:MAG: toll/interleukin-1 receptor domain-containing protein [Bacteroidales bacterium]|nr:toll/interleukin-1 receptor domain-containing protein [Bacteroidales bacterium]
MEDQKTENVCVNEGRPVYFSYARNSTKKPGWDHISDCVDELLKIFEQENIEYRLDKRDIGTGDKISDFEKEIGWKSEAVVLVFSDKYFRSPHCMYEFVQIKKSLELYPQKRLLCIKSGDFNLSDVNYIMELERFWSNKRQEYEEIEFHRLRNHSGTEQAAYENGFYMNDIRQLYSFFSAINYQYSNNIDWKGFINDIRQYYSTTPKPDFKKLEEPKKKSKFRLAYLLTWLVGTIIFFICLVVAMLYFLVKDDEPTLQNDGISHPAYTKGVNNCYVTNINAAQDSTTLQIHLVNDSDADSTVYATDGFYIIAGGNNYFMTRADGIAVQPGKTIVAKGDALDYIITFPAIHAGTDSIDFIGGEMGIYGLKINRKIKPSIVKPTIFTGNYGQLTISEVEMNDDGTVLHFLYKNTGDSAARISAPERPYIYAAHKKYALKNALCIAKLPDGTLVPKGSSMSYALEFEPIDTTAHATKIDYVEYEDEEAGEVKGFFGINVERSKQHGS